jgi:hypothetical protein
MSSSVIFWCIVLIGVPLVVVILAACVTGSRADDDMARYMEEINGQKD